MRRVVLACIDGCSPEYLRGARFLKRADLYCEGWSMIPSVTNVNTVSILTGEYPCVHGVTGNYYYDRLKDRWVYMESPDFIRVETLVERAVKLGLKAAVLTSKDKLRILLGRGASLALSAEKPPRWLVEELGEPPHVYSIEVDGWLMQAAVKVARRLCPDLMCIITTDYAMHKYPPSHPESRRHIESVDAGLEELVEFYEGRGEEPLLCVTADHGVEEKRWAVDLELALREREVGARVNVLIADRYVAHHGNMGGAAYVYLEETELIYRALEALQDLEGVEVALTSRQAARLFHLDESRIGDLVVLAAKDYVFGSVGEEKARVMVRSHGSLHEGRVPIALHGVDLERCPRENREVARIALSWLQGVRASGEVGPPSLR